MKSERKYSRDVCIPLIFSVTGHTDICPDDIPFVEDQLNKLFKQFQALYPETPLMLLSALADGADRIAAHVALRNGMNVGPVLPFELEEYEKTFTGAGFAVKPGQNEVSRSIEEFRELLSDPGVYSPCVLNKTCDDPCDGYRSVSAYLIANSHIMISIWDGHVYHQNLGGTYDTTRMAYSGIDAELLGASSPSFRTDENSSCLKYLNVMEDCLIYWIGVRRNSDPVILESRNYENNQANNGRSAFIVPYLLQQRAIESEWHPRVSLYETYKTKSRNEVLKNVTDTLTRSRGFLTINSNLINLEESGIFPKLYDREFFKMDTFNRDVLNNKDAGGCGWLTDAESQTSRTDWDTRFHMLEQDTGKIKGSGAMDDMALRYNAADQLSEISRNKSNFSIRFIISTSALMILFFNLFLLMENVMELIVLFAIFMVASRLISIHHTRGEEYRKYVEYRSLAESLRVNYYWGLAEINDTAASSFYQYLRNDTLWIRSALCSWSSYFLNEYDTSCVSMVDKTLSIRDSWIKNQLDYHLNKVIINGNKYKRLNIFKKISAMGLFIISSTLILIQIVNTEFLQTELISFAVHGEFVSISTLVLVKLCMIIFGVIATLSNSMFDMVYGGTPDQIESKILMFELANRRSEAVDRRTESKTDSYNSESPVNNPPSGDYVMHMIGIIKELGIQSLDENNDWVFEFKNKDIKKVHSVNSGID